MLGLFVTQCGITRKQLPKFVEFLKDLGRQYRWDGILGLNYLSYKSHGPSAGSRYLLDFLNDEAGWEFVRDVARNLSQRDRGIVETSELEQLKGYHPSFWVEVIGLLKLASPKIRSKNIPLPNGYDVSGYYANFGFEYVNPDEPLPPPEGFRTMYFDLLPLVNELESQLSLAHK